MKERYLWIGIILAIISWGGNYVYYQSQQLEKPIFLEHYYEAFVEDDLQLTFYYLTNKVDPLDVMDVEINGILVSPVSTGGFSMWSNQGPQYERAYRHHYLKSVTIDIPPQALSLKEDSEETWSFQTMEVSFNNGQVVKADIGEVLIRAQQFGPPILETRSSSSSNQHYSEKSIIAMEPVTVEDISIPFVEKLQGKVLVKVAVHNRDELTALEGDRPPSWLSESLKEEWSQLSGVTVQKGIFPFELEMSEWLRLSMAFEPERNSYYNFCITIKGTTEAGNPITRCAPIIDHPYLDQEKINQIIAANEGGQQNE